LYSLLKLIKPIVENCNAMRLAPLNFFY